MSVGVEQHNIPTEIGSYRLIRQIGRGGSSEVWLAEHAHIEERRVAIKVLMAYDRETRLRFSREAAIAGRLRHPNVVQIYDFGHDKNLTYSVLEYIEGGNLRDLLEKRESRRLSLVEAAGIFRQLAAAVDYAHTLNIIHRDISPGNVLVEQDSWRAVLSDFGIARGPDRSITTVSTVMGTAGFISPEHAQSAAMVTHLSDIFCLGIIFYYMLSGELPWQEAPELPNPSFGPVVPLRDRIGEALPADVEQVIGTMLALDPARRFSTAGQAAEQIDAIIARHQMATTVLDKGPALTPRVAADFRAEVMPPDPVEVCLGPDLIRAPLGKSRKRGEDMGRPAVIAGLLDAWSNQNRRVRLWPLGRLARLHKATSRNVYFYQLRVLYERREAPGPIEEPDRKRESFPLGRELDRWEVTLPLAEEFEDQQGERVVLPGSTRVVGCPACNELGVVICSRCNGSQRVYVTRPVQTPGAQAPQGGAPRAPASPATGAPGAAGARPAAPAAPAPGAAQPLPTAAPAMERVLVPCPECSGRGGTTCGRCAGEARLVQRKAFNWQRSVAAFAQHDDLPNVDEEWLRKSCRSELIYQTRHRDGLRPEWFQVPVLNDMAEAARARADEQTRIVLSELIVSFIPVTEIVFDLGGADRKGQPELYKLPIYGFENIIPADWRLLDWERISMALLSAFLIVVTLIMGLFAFA